MVLNMSLPAPPLQRSTSFSGGKSCGDCSELISRSGRRLSLRRARPALRSLVGEYRAPATRRTKRGRAGTTRWPRTDSTDPKAFSHFFHRCRADVPWRVGVCGGHWRVGHAILEKARNSYPDPGHLCGAIGSPLRGSRRRQCSGGGPQNCRRDPEVVPELSKTLQEILRGGSGSLRQCGWCGGGSATETRAESLML